ncbi:putative TPR repeat methyltransferase [Sulfitobacter undariae]|uniref:Putative TPR repeat methyltransferase n=1 Tax=Sulfitobacter undariae TaxID=1563671 RepID=A0A7W6H287_9RHOB|nr:methyltransferase domain-containing protein [Sulfitobacter undariae]MBB3994549.1 putative TPR repeat methyltransferase [Sulfitobacter undariae]
MIKTFLDRIYTADDPADLRAIYQEWAASYDADITASGYATPRRCAEALAQFADDKTEPVLDFGCGTGLSGQALREVGFDTLDGADVSPNMLEKAREKDIYRDLALVEEDISIDTPYRLMSAVGVIGTGAGHMTLLNTLLRGLPSGGKLVFSLNDLSLAEPKNIGMLNDWLDCGAARLLFAEHGTHLPAKGISSTAYVIEKA